MIVRSLFALIPFLAVVVLGSSSITSVATLAPAKEPGARLVVSGQVFDHTGTRGVAGVKLHAYHTDAKGLYHGPLAIKPRLNGTVVTDGQGRFQWRTIRPMPYPGGGNPAHIHIEASGGGYPKQWVDELWFSDDPNLTASMKATAAAKGKFNPIVTTKRDPKGVLHATFNIRLSNNPKR